MDSENCADRSGKGKMKADSLTGPDPCSCGAQESIST